LRWAGLVLGLWLAAGPVHAGRLLWGGEPPAGRVLLDAQGQMNATQASRLLEAGGGEPYSEDVFYPFQRDNAVWLRFELPFMPEGAVLALPHPGLNRADLYQRDADGAWQVQRSGDARPVAEWAVPNLHPAFVVTMPPGESAEVLIRVAHNHPVTLPWRLWSKPDFEASRQVLLLLLGAYLGFVLLVVCVSAFNWLVWGDRLYLTNAFYVLMIGATQVTLTGIGGQFLWPTYPVWNDYSAVVLPLLGATTAGWFTYRVVANRAPRVWRVSLLVYCVLGLALTLAFAVFEREPVFHLANLYFLLCTPLCLVAMTDYALRNPRVGWWFVAGFAALFLGALFAVLRNLGLVAMSPLTQFGAQIGAGVEVPLLLVGLYCRSRERRDNQVRMGALARVDPLTGLSSHRVLLERLAQPRPAGDAPAVLRIRVGNARVLRDDYGLEVLQAALVHAGGCVTHVAREGDTVARHRDGDLVLLLGGRPTRADAAAVAQRIIARGLAHTSDLPERQVLRLLVAAAVPPWPVTSGVELLDALDGLIGDLQARPGKALRFLE
jgi:GGDEF domain-containing protein